MAADEDFGLNMQRDWKYMRVPSPLGSVEYRHHHHVSSLNDDEHIQWGVISLLEHINLGPNNLTGRLLRPDEHRQKLVRDVIESCITWTETNPHCRGSFNIEDIRIIDGVVQLNVCSSGDYLSNSLLKLVRHVLHDLAGKPEFIYLNKRIRMCTSTFDFQQLFYQPILWSDEYSLFFILRFLHHINYIGRSDSTFDFVYSEGVVDSLNKREHLKRILEGFGNNLKGLMDYAKAVAHDEVTMTLKEKWWKIVDMFPDIHLDIFTAIDDNKIDLSGILSGRNWNRN